MANDDMYIIWIIWELCVFQSVSGTLYLSNKYLNWKDSMNDCGSRSIATLENTPLNSSEWSSIKLDSDGGWLGSYYIVTPFYWTNGDCFQFNSSAVKDAPWKPFRNLTAEKCAIFCASKSSLVKYIALQDTHCYCLDKKPDTSFPDGCKKNCTGVLNERCGSVQRESIFAYRKQEDSQRSGIRRFKETDDIHENCITLFADDSRGSRKVYFDQKNCSKQRSFLCQKDGSVSPMLRPHLTFEDATNYCMRLNKTLAYLTSHDTKIDSTLDNTIKGGTNYWIGLRRFSKLESVDNLSMPSETTTHKMCLAITKGRGNRITPGPKNCSSELKYVCREKQSRIGTSPTRSIVENSKSIQSDEIITKSTVNISNTIADKEGLIEDPTSSSSTGAAIGGIIGVAVILVLIGILVFCLYKRKSKNLKRTPSYREPKVEYSSKRKDSEFEVLNTSGNNNKVGTPPSKPVRRTKSGKGSVKGTEYENIVLELEDPKLLTKAISQGSNGSCSVSRMKAEAESEYSHIQGKSQRSFLPNDQENYYDSGKTVKAEANVNDIHGESETEYDVMNRDRFRENEDPNTEYDHIQNVINSKNNFTST